MTLNSLVQKIQTICESHVQICTVKNKSVIDLMDEDVIYPAVSFTVNDMRFITGGMSADVSFFFLDRMLPEQDNERDAQSDMVQVAFDIVSLLKRNSNDFEVDGDVSVSLFADDTPDVVAGCMIDVSFEVPMEVNRCVIPI